MTVENVRVTIRYVDGTVVEFPAAAWAAHRADGVDWVTVANTSGLSVFQGHSAYWLYADGDTWVAGQASFGYSNTPPEVLFLPNGTQAARAVRYVPDLIHDTVKLGAWRPGEEKPPWPVPST